MARRRGGQRHGASRVDRPEPRPPRVVPMLALSLLLLVGGWTALWFFARYEAVASFARWRQTERSFGRAWTCPNEQVSGFPLGIALTCDHPTFKGPVGDGLFAGGIAALSAEAQLYFPTNVVVTLTGPLQMTEVAGPRRVDASWTSGVLTLRGALPGDLDRGTLELADLGLGPVASAGAAPPFGRIEHLTLGFKPMNRNAESRMDLDANVAATGVHLPALDAAIGTSDPMALHFSGFATQVSVPGGATLPELLDPWIVAGGQIHVQSLDLDKGTFRMRAAGRLGLDEEHRLAGRLDAGFSGLGPVAARLGIPIGAVQVGGLLSGLLGGAAAPAPTADEAPAELSLPIIAKDGHVRLGPVDTGLRLQPLY